MGRDSIPHKCCLCGCDQPAGAYILLLPQDRSYSMCENCSERVLTQLMHPDAVEADLHAIVDRMVSILERQIQERELDRLEKQAQFFWDSRW